VVFGHRKLTQWTHSAYTHKHKLRTLTEKRKLTRMWANAQRDGRPAEYRWRRMLNAAVWLAPTARVPCSNAASIGKCKTWRTQGEFCTWQNFVTGQQPPEVHKSSTSPGDGQTSCKVWLASVERRRCSNEAETRKPLKFAEVPQTRQSISAASGPKFAVLWRHNMEEILLLNNFSDCRYVP